VNTEVASDVHELNFNTRALEEDKDAIVNISEKIEELIKDASISVGKVPFIISESLRFHGTYNITDDYFIDNYADAFGSILIKEVGYYDAIQDSFNITNYFFDLNNHNLTTIGALRSYLENVSPEYSQYSSLGSIAASLKSTSPLFFMKNFNFVASGDYQKYKDVTYIKSRIGPVNKVFIELAKDNNPFDYDKIIYFCFNDKEKIEGIASCHESLETPYVAVCDFKDYNMNYIIRKNIFEKSSPFNVNHITTVASYEDPSSPYYNIYLI
jgi:hypothetical protein